MIYVAWRQLRSQAAALSLAVASCLVALALTRPHIAADATNVLDLLSRAQRNMYLAAIVVLAAVPPLIGAFFGAPLVAREIESGTHRLIWSQSVTRRRWLVVKLATAALVAAVAVGVLCFAVTRWSAQLDGATGQTRGGLPSRLTPVAFAMRGVVPVGYAIFALALGALLGTMLRRTLPAMALTLLLTGALQVAFPLVIRPHLVSSTASDVIIDRTTLDGISLTHGGTQPKLTAHTADRGDWILTNETVDASGTATALPASFASCLPRPDSPAEGDESIGSPQRAEQPAPNAPNAPNAKTRLDGCLAALADAGYRQHVVYLPADRFWALQVRELAVFLAVAAALVAAHLALIRRV